MGKTARNGVEQAQVLPAARPLVAPPGSGSFPSLPLAKPAKPVSYAPRGRHDHRLGGLLDIILNRV